VLAAPSAANKINTVVHVIPSGAFFEARIDQQCKNIMRHPVEIQTHAHGCAVCRTVQISDEDFGGRSSRIGSALAGARSGDAERDRRHCERKHTRQVMMQSAAFILDVGDPMPMVAVTARRAVIVCA
jgi:hypothetical protein